MKGIFTLILLECLIIIQFNLTNANKTNSFNPKLLGFKSRSDVVKWSNEQPPVIEIPVSLKIQMELYGEDMTQVVYVAFTTASNFSSTQQLCDLKRSTVGFPVRNNQKNFALVDVNIRHSRADKARYFFCIGVNTSSVKENFKQTTWLFQGSYSHLSFRTFEKKSILPLWLQISIIIILFVLSGLFSGLNLGLMALNLTELNIIEQAGASSERRYAKIIKPIRRRGNFLLCTLLLGNVLVNNTLAILMDDLTGSGLMAIIISTLGIVIFGEIIPQAICSRHGLCIGAKTIWITKFFMIITGIISFPVSLLLDLVLGKELGQVYNREKLEILIKEQQVHGSVVKAEAQIIAGALTLTTKLVRDIMTPLCDVFMISHDAVLDFTTMNEIVRNGFTRVPIYEESRTSITAVLNVKDLAFIDPDDRIPVATVCQFYNRSILVVDENTNLRAMLEDFRQGKAHMAFVERMVTDGEGDPYRETIGLVTLEDVIEEIIQAEIMDETDVITDNVRKQRRLINNQDFSVFNIPETGKYPRLSPQLKVAALRHLSSNVRYFGENFLSSQVLQSLLNANIVIEHTLQSNNDKANEIYQNGVPASFAVLLLQGKVNVIVSAEQLLFEAGPFVLLGEILFEKSLGNLPTEETIISNQHKVGSLITTISNKCTFTPDYTVTATSNLQYLKITSRHYLFARILTILQNSGSSNPNKISLDHSPTKGSGDITFNVTPSHTGYAQPTTILMPVTNPSIVHNDIILTEPQLNLAALRNKKSLTTASLHLMRDFYQTEWEKLMEPTLTDELEVSPSSDSENKTEKPNKDEETVNGEEGGGVQVNNEDNEKTKFLTNSEKTGDDEKSMIC